VSPRLARSGLALGASALLLLALGCPKKTEAPTDSGATKEVGASSAPSLRPDPVDLEGIKGRGELRVLVFGAEASFLPRAGSVAYDRELATRFAQRIGVPVRFVRAERFDELLDLLEQGFGDIVAARMTVTPARQKRASFTRPTRLVSEVLIGSAADKGKLPTAMSELAGVAVHVRPSSSWATTLRELGAQVVPVDERLDDDEVAHLVGAQKLPLSVIDSDSLEVLRSYTDTIRPLLTLKEAQQVAWAVRKDAAALKLEVDAFVVEQALMADRDQTWTGDLGVIKERGVLRVLTRNTPWSYFLHRGEPRGFDYELAKGVADALGVRLEVIVPPTGADLIPWLEEGRGDIIAAAFTITPEREERLLFSTPYLFVDEVVVQRKDAPALKRVEDLAGKTVWVRPSSSYEDTLRELQKRVPLEIKAADAHKDTHQLIDQVVRGDIERTVADEHILQAELTWRDDVVASLPITEAAADARDPIGKPAGGAKSIAFATRKTSPALKAFLDEHVRRHYRGTHYNLAKRRYFEDVRVVRSSHGESYQESGKLSDYDDVIRRHASARGLDWRLLAAQAWRESHFDPKAKSWVGARGLFQVMPRTGAEMGYFDLEDPEVGTEAGVRYFAELIDAFDARLPFEERVRFALASYNAGRGHVLDARRLAEKLGKNPDRWYGHVSEAMLLLKERRYFRKARHGYCRGDEPVAYVRDIEERYRAYARLVPP
jgi:membrane-bound lytic murein transglycosylase F